MSDATIWYFVKFFTEEKHADQFINGSLHLERLSYFKKIEDNYNDGRADTNEAVAIWWQPHDLSIKIEIPGIGDVEITEADLPVPSPCHMNSMTIFIFSALYVMRTTGFKTIAGKLDLAESEAAELQSQFLERCLKTWPFAVVTPAVPFHAQLKEALRRNGQSFKGALVEYYDDETFHGEIALKDIPFRKQKRFSYQKEFRICVQTATRGDDPITIDIGDISHICAKMKSSQLNAKFELKFEPSPATPKSTADQQDSR